MRDLDFPVTPFACNQLILMYKKLNKKKIADVLLLMEKDDVKPSRHTYKLLIDTKGQTNDITGMEELVKTMKSEGFELDDFIRPTLVKHYICAGMNEKAEEIVKEMEGEDLNDTRGACKTLLHLYADLGKAEDVERIWKVCESNLRIGECLAAVGAWGKVGRVEKAEEVFELMIKTWKNPPVKCYTTLLDVFAKHKLLAKGKDLAKRMASDGYRVDPLAWDSLVKLFVEAGEVEKADSVLQKAIQQDHRVRPMFNSFMVIMEQYSKRGDIHNTERIFHKLRQSGYVRKIRQYQCLLQAYVNAKAPAYGFRDRMKADSVFPNKSVAGQLTQIDTFKKTVISDLLD
ncbi:pentatricopeptide repeat-containing protein At1g80270, mitochondrial-like [Papaver somniferum]|uniref:pentatricopeptide repeat-containing protein At1g80270, mitochondrial-like n=1 Tax=Papaver somniferum TaxID=3469 RepID=UPI000E6FE855|nr:pentatricopeptide repeat-containing protein At1g80270, mitochondrial-like [Papaver somniferum]